jgi:hypothetical protein
MRVASNAKVDKADGSWSILRVFILIGIFLAGMILGVSCSFIEGEMRVDREKEWGGTFILWDSLLGPLIQPEGLRYSDYYENNLSSNAPRYLYVENNRIFGVILQIFALGIILGTIKLRSTHFPKGEGLWKRWTPFMAIFLGIGLIFGLELAFHNTFGVLLVILSGTITAMFAMFSVQEASRGPSR